MSEGGGEGSATDLAAVEARLRELQRRKRESVRWHMSRNTAERAIAAIAGGSRGTALRTTGKSRRRRRHKRLL
jgi:anti-sigma factor RsiW